MDINSILDTLKDWLNKVLDALLGPQAQPEHEVIPIPVDDRHYRR